MKYGPTDRTKRPTDRTFGFSPADKTFHNCMSSPFGILLGALICSKGYILSSGAMLDWTYRGGAYGQDKKNRRKQGFTIFSTVTKYMYW
jgi:hypothetical protein